MLLPKQSECGEIKIKRGKGYWKIRHSFIHFWSVDVPTRGRRSCVVVGSWCQCTEYGLHGSHSGYGDVLQYWIVVFATVSIGRQTMTSAYWQIILEWGVEADVTGATDRTNNVAYSEHSRNTTHIYLDYKIYVCTSLVPVWPSNYTELSIH